MIPVLARAGARRTGLNGEHAEMLRVEVSTAPERGRANEAIAEVLAEALGCRPTAVRLLAGLTSRQKKFLVVGLSPDEVRGRLMERMGKTDES